MSLMLAKCAQVQLPVKIEYVELALFLTSHPVFLIPTEQVPSAAGISITVSAYPLSSF